MKKTVLSIMILMGITSPMVAEELHLFPTQATQEISKGIALIWGSEELNQDKSYSGDIVGVELSMPCRLLQGKQRPIRQQISLSRYDHHDKLITLGMNPHYIFQFADQFQLGVGPSFEISYVDSDNTSKDTLMGVGVSGSLEKEFTNHIFFGMELGYTWLNDSDFQNFKAIGKIGYRIDNWNQLFK